MISVSNYSRSISKVNIERLPKVLQDGHEFFLEAWEWYQKDDTVTESIDLYLKKLNNLLVRKPTTEGIAPVDQRFVKRFMNLHGKVKTKEQLGYYLGALQRAISKGQIRKSSFFARHIERIQEKLIDHYNKLPNEGKIEVKISEPWKNELQSALKTVKNDVQMPISGLSAENQKPKKKSLFKMMSDIDLTRAANSFRLSGDLGGLLGDLERFELAITLEGDQGGGKTRFSYQLANAFASIGDKVAIFSLEIGVKSDLVLRMMEEYLQTENRKNIFITDQLPHGIETIRQEANHFDVIIIDSWNKLNAKSSEFDKLRKDFPNTIFIVIFQRTTQGTIRGGNAPLFDSGINIELVKVDDTFVNNYAVATKNRYGVTGIRYNLHQQKITNHPIATVDKNE